MTNGSNELSNFNTTIFFKLCNAFLYLCVLLLSCGGRMQGSKFVLPNTQLTQYLYDL